MAQYFCLLTTLCGSIFSLLTTLCGSIFRLLITLNGSIFWLTYFPLGLAHLILLTYHVVWLYFLLTYNAVYLNFSAYIPHDGAYFSCFLLYWIPWGLAQFVLLTYHEVWHNFSLDLTGGAAKFLSILTTRCGSIFLKHHGVDCRSIFKLLTYKTVWLIFATY